MWCACACTYMYLPINTIRESQTVHLNNKYPVLIIQTLLNGAAFDYPVTMHTTTHGLTSRTASSE